MQSRTSARIRWRTKSSGGSWQGRMQGWWLEVQHGLRGTSQLSDGNAGFAGNGVEQVAAPIGIHEDSRIAQRVLAALDRAGLRRLNRERCAFPFMLGAQDFLGCYCL